MDFIIKQNATLPILMMKVIENNDLDSDALKEMLKNSVVTFSMIDVETGKYVIGNRPGGIVSQEDVLDLACGVDSNEYAIYYEWRSKDTKTPGVYMGEFTINVLDSSGADGGKLIVPMQDQLHIYIQESFGKTSLNGF